MSSPATTTSRCQICGARLPAGTPDDLCPLCVMEEPMQPGARVLGDCELFEEIGRGGMGVVWRGRQRRLDREVAVKTLPGGDLAGADARARFQKEAQAAARLKHPGIVTIHEVGEADGMPYFVMELVHGRTLSAVIAEKPVPVRIAARWLHEVALAVQHAHEQGVLHRDLKPSNILIESGDDIGRPRITDFGLAKLTDDDSQLTLSGSAAGSPAYMSPEQARQGGSTALSDVYGLGAVLYAALTGRPPFQGETIAAVLEQVNRDDPLPPRRLNGSIPRDLETICLKALEKTPARRYATARDFADDLARFIEGKAVLARPVGWSGKIMRWASRRPALAASLALAVLALITAVVVAAISAIHIKEAGDRALASAAAEKSQAHEARLRATRLHIAEAVRRQEDGDFIGALPWLVAALRSGMDDPVERDEHTLRLAAALHQCPRLLHHWTLNGWRDKRDAALVSPGRVYAADFSPDGQWIAAATGNTRVYLWNTETGEDAGADFPAQEQVQFVRFSADGRRLLTGTSADTITLWDVATKTAVISEVSHALNGWHPASLLPPLMNADGSVLIRAEPGKKPESGAYLVFTDGKTNPIPLRIGITVRALGLSGDGSLIAVGSTDGKVTVHDATTGQSIGTGFRVKGSVRGLSFSPDKKLLGVICGDNNAQIWRLDTLTEVGTPAPHSGVIYELTWSPDGTHLATAAFGERNSILMRADTGAADVVIRHRMGIRSAVFNTAGTRLLTAGFDNMARFFDPLSGRVSGPPLHHAAYVSTALFSPDGKRVFTGSFDGTARLWELPENASPADEMVTTKASPSVRYLARRDTKVGETSAITIYSMADGSSIGCPGTGVCGGLGDDGRTLIWLGGDAFELRMLDESKAPHTLCAFTVNGFGTARGSVRYEEISPDSRYAVISLDRQTMTVHDLSSSPVKITGTLKLSEPFALDAFSPQGDLFASASPIADEKTLITIWHLPEARKVSSFIVPQTLGHLKFSYDGRMIAWGARMASLYPAPARIHWCASGDPVTPYLPHRGSIEALEFSPDSSLLATGSRDAAVRLWDTATGKLAAPQLQHPVRVGSIGFSRDGHRLVTTAATSPPEIRVWNANTGVALTPPIRISAGASYTSITDDGTTLLNYGGTFTRWPLTDNNRAPADLIEAAELLSVHRQNDLIGPIPIPANELREMHKRRKSGTAQAP